MKKLLMGIAALTITASAFAQSGMGPSTTPSGTTMDSSSTMNSDRMDSSNPAATGTMSDPQLMEERDANGAIVPTTPSTRRTRTESRRTGPGSSATDSMGTPAGTGMDSTPTDSSTMPSTTTP